MKNTTAAVLLVLGLLVLAGCNRVSSCDVLTDGLYLDLLVTEEDGQATVRADLWVGDAPRGTSVEIGPCGDAIAVNGVNLQEVRGVWTYYEAVLTPAAAYEFVLTRPGKASYSSTVTPPPTVTILAPSPGSELSRRSPLSVQWNANGDPSQTLHFETYVQFPPHGQTDLEPFSDGFSVADDGQHSFDLATLEDAQNAADDWTAEVTLMRSVEGQLDPALNGRIWAQSVDSVEFVSRP